MTETPSSARDRAVTALADEYERGTAYGTSPVLVQVAARLRETLGDQPRT